MAENTLDFIQSLADRSDARTLSLSELDQQPVRHSRPQMDVSVGIPVTGSSSPSAAHPWRQPPIQPHVHPQAHPSSIHSRLKDDPREYLAGVPGQNEEVVKAYD